MGETVEYVLNLRDQFSGVMETAKKHTEQFEHTMSHATERVKEMGVAMLEIAGIYEGFEFLKGSVEAFSEAESAVAQLKAGLESTGGVAGVTLQEMTEQAKKFSETLPFAKAEIMNIQSQLLTFPAITKETFGQTTQTILDMSSRLHHSTQELSIALGKALQDPMQGVTALHRVGVNFNAQQREMIKHMVETGHAARAQQMILKELSTEYGGSAMEAASTFSGQMKILNNEFEEQKERLGEIIAHVVMRLKPAMEWMIEKFGELIDWSKRHKELLEGIAITVGVVAGLWLTYEATLLAVSVATKAFSVVTFVLGTAIEAVGIALQFLEANPIILVLTIITLAVVELYKHFAWARGVIWGIWEVLKGLASFLANSFLLVLKGVGEVIHGIFHMNWSEIQTGLKDSMQGTAQLFTGYGFDAASSFKKGFADGEADFNHSQSPTVHLIQPGDTTRARKLGAAPTSPAATSPGNRVSGQKVQTFNISINGGLVHEMIFHTTNITDSYGRIKEGVVRALTSAVNDSQIIGDH